jgi:hypothetical protein
LPHVIHAVCSINPSRINQPHSVPANPPIRPHPPKNRVRASGEPVYRLTSAVHPSWAMARPFTRAALSASGAGWFAT